MIVLDASVAFEWLIQTMAGRAIGGRLFSPGETLHAPHLLDAEVCQALRRAVAAQHLTYSRAAQALGRLHSFRIRRYAHRPFLQRVWELRGNLTAYDALYVALAEGLDATLLTRDGKLASAPGHRAQIELV